MSFTEFSYQLIQGYDFYWLWKNKNVSLQMGGSDQWGNITTGTELIRRKGSGEAFALTAPLLKKSDGSKFGKSEGGNIWLDKTKTSPYKFYQYWLNSSDEDAGKFMRIFTFKTKEEIEQLEAEHSNDPGRRILQKELAKAVTIMVHSEDDFETALAASDILFGKSTEDDLRKIGEDDFLNIFEGVDQAEIPKEKLESGLGIIDALASESGFLKSNGEARRALKENSISVNKSKVSDDKVITPKDLLNGRYILLQRGKKKYFILKVTQ
jgi:tyrosyl-tRNA synthetase